MNSTLITTTITGVKRVNIVSIVDGVIIPSDTFNMCDPCYEHEIAPCLAHLEKGLASGIPSPSYLGVNFDAYIKTEI